MTPKQIMWAVKMLLFAILGAVLNVADIQTRVLLIIAGLSVTISAVSYEEGSYKDGK